jgi:hypothetical protein
MKIDLIVNAAPFPYTFAMSAVPTHTTFTESIHAAWILFQDHFKTFFLLAVLVHLPLNVLIDATTQRNVDWEYMVRLPWDQWDPLFFVNAGLVVLASLLGMLVTVAVIVVTQRALRHEVTTVADALGVAVGFWPKVFVTSLVSLILIVAGTFLLFLPGIILAVLFVFSTYAVVLANRWGLKALGYSARLVSRHPSVVVVRLVAVGVLVGLPAFGILASAGQVELYGIPAIGDTLVDIILMFATVYFTTLFLELEQRMLEN